MHDNVPSLLSYPSCVFDHSIHACVDLFPPEGNPRLRTPSPWDTFVPTREAYIACIRMWKPDYIHKDDFTTMSLAWWPMRSPWTTDAEIKAYVDSQKAKYKDEATAQAFAKHALDAPVEENKVRIVYLPLPQL